MKSKHKLIILILIEFICLKTTNSQPLPPGYTTSVNAEKCKEKGEKGRARKFADCKPESDNSSICCFFTGTYNGEKYEGCISMDMEIFSNRSIKYNFNSVSATLICQDNYNFDKFINYRYLFYFYLFICIFLL